MNDTQPDASMAGAHRLHPWRINSFRRNGSFRQSSGANSSIAGPVVALQSEMLLSDNQRMQRHFEPDGGPVDRTFKVVFAGDAAVGKSSFITRLTMDVFVPHTTTTLGVDFKVKTIRLDERNIAVQLWDTAGTTRLRHSQLNVMPRLRRSGQERFRSITQSYFRKADGVMLLFDVSNERSFLNIRHWSDCLAEVCDSHPSSSRRKDDRHSIGIPLVLVGTKSDLRTAGGITTCVDPAQVERLAAQLKAPYVETSSKMGVNLLEALATLTRLINLICIRKQNRVKARNCYAMSRQMMITQDIEVQTLKLTENRKNRILCCGTKS